MSTVAIQLDALHSSQVEIKDRLQRFNVIDCGRRFGKNILEKDRAITTMLSGYPVGWFEPTYKSLADIWREIKSTVHPITKDRSEQEKRIEIMTGGTLDMWSLDDPDSGRGRKYKLVIVNEAAKVKQLEYSWENVLRATLADLKGGADFTSTPKGLNFYFSLWDLAERAPDWARFQRSTYDNPHIDRDEIEAMRATMPERVFKQEILAEFVEDGAYFQNVSACAVIEAKDAPEQHQGHTLYMATDWAKSNDFHVSGVACRECNKVVDWERFNNVDYIYQRQRMNTLRERWEPAWILPERNSMGEPNIELLVADGWPILEGHDEKPGFYTGPTTKPPLIESLAQAFIVHGFKVPKEAYNELAVYEVNILPSGHSTFGAPDNQHDDWVMMLALLWRAMTANAWVMVGRGY